MNEEKKDVFARSLELLYECVAKERGITGVTFTATKIDRGDKK